MGNFNPGFEIVVDVACAALACIATGSLLAKRMFPTASPPTYSAAMGFLLMGSAILFLVVPIGRIAAAIGAAGILGVVAAGWLLAMRRGPTEACDCFGALTPPGRLFPTAMLLIAGCCAALVFASMAYPGVSPRGWLPAALTFAGTIALSITFNVIKYRRAFYNPGALEGPPPEELPRGTILGSASGRALGIEEVLGQSDVAIIILLSSACTSCHALLNEFRSRLGAGVDGFNVAFVSNHPRIFADAPPPPGAYFAIDERMTTARAMLAPKLPVGFAVNDRLELIAPPSNGNAAILSLFSFVQDAKAS